jgi:hypothetical protein
MARYEIRCIGDDSVLDRVEARSPLEALDAYSERQGFASYGPPLAVGEHQGEDDDRIRPYPYRGTWGAVFTNYEIYAALEGGDAPAEALVLGVLFDPPSDRVADALRSALAEGRAVRGGTEDGWAFVRSESVTLHDLDDPDSGPLVLMHGALDGSAATILAPGTLDLGEAERRLYRDVSSDFTIDDSDRAVPIREQGDEDDPLAEPLSLDTMGEDDLRKLAKDLLPRALSEDEVSALFDLMSDPELYIDDGEGGWVPAPTFEQVLQPLLERLRAMRTRPAPAPPREILVHLNVSVAADDRRSPDEIGAFLHDCMSVGLDGHDAATGERLAAGILDVTVALADEV